MVWGPAVRRRICGAAALVLALPAGVAAAGPPAPDTSGAVQEIGAVGTTAALPAHCGPGSRPETGMQGDVPAADRDNGRSAQGYNCNITRIGGFAGYGAGIVSASYDHCAHLGSIIPSSLVGPMRACRSSTRRTPRIRCPP